MMHVPQRTLRAWKRISQLQRSTFQNIFFRPAANHCGIHWLVTSIKTNGLRWLEDTAKSASRLFVSPWSGCFASFARSVRYQWRVAATCGTQPETSETFATMSMVHDWRPCTWRVNAQLEAWMLLGQVFDMVCLVDVNISLSPSLLQFLSVLRHVQPAAQLLFLSQLARQLAEQLDCERGCCQPPVFEASVPLSDSQHRSFLSQRSWSPCVSHFNHVQNARCSMPRPMFEKAWNSGSYAIFRWLDVISLSNQWYNDFIWFHLWPFVARSMWATLPITVKRAKTLRNCLTFWHQPPADVDAIAWACCVACLVCGILPNQDLLPVASTEEESEKDKNRHLAGQDPNWHLVAMSLWEKLSTVPTLSQRHIAKTF